MGGNLPDVPLEVFVAWPTPNYVDPVRRTWMPAYSGVLQAITTILVSIRLWLRIRNTAGPFGLDDLVLIPAFLGATMFTIIVDMDCLRYGVDRHLWDVPPEQYESLALMCWLSELAFLISTCCTKVSVLLFYRRLAKGTYNRIWRWLTVGAIYLTIVYGVGLILALVVNCRPTNAYWKSLSLSYTEDFICTDTRWLNPVSGAISVTSDFYAVVLPMGMLHNFEIDRRKKIALYSVFSLGLLVVAAGSARTYYLSELGYNYDITWTGFNTFIWTVLEVQLAIICASIPVLRVLFRHYLRGPLSRSRPRGRNTPSGARHDNERSRLAVERAVAIPATPKQQYSSSSKYNMTASLGSVSEYDAEPRPASPDIGKPHAAVVKTPEDFEVYALRCLNEYRSSPRTHGYVRTDSSAEQDCTTSESTGGAKTPVSWLDIEIR